LEIALIVLFAVSTWASAAWVEPSSMTAPRHKPAANLDNILPD
jgi:hypothetical protein